jgi:hypothetical protein
MRGRVISYIEMCQKEGTSLQRGMNFRLKGGHSVILMSVRPNAPYRDEVQDDGTTLSTKDMTSQDERASLILKLWINQNGSLAVP